MNRIAKLGVSVLLTGSVLAMRARTREMIAAESSREEIESMLRAEFYWGDLHLTMGFDGLLAEL